jgi:hypothetical protein
MTYDQEYKARNHGEEIDALLSERDSMTPRPDDEMDLTQNKKAFGLLHHETKRAFEEWPHGVEVYLNDGAWTNLTLPHWRPHRTFRAKPAPAPNLIERVGNEPSSTGREHTLWLALHAAHALIATMSDGDAQKRASYEWLIK